MRPNWRGVKPEFLCARSVVQMCSSQVLLEVVSTKGLYNIFVPMNSNVCNAFDVCYVCYVFNLNNVYKVFNVFNVCYVCNICHVIHVCSVFNFCNPCNVFNVLRQLFFSRQTFA